MITREVVIKALQQVNDPELNMNVFFLGLIHDIAIDGDKVKIKLTFTTPFCPYAASLVEEIKSKIKEAGAKEVAVEVLTEKWEPSEDVKLALDL